MNKAIVIATFLLCTFFSATAQIQVKSKIIDKETKKAIPFANISIAETTKGTISNKEGDFQLYISTSGLNTRVLVSSLGYQTVSIHPKKIGEVIKLIPVTYDISEVKVSASKLMSDPKKILKECMKAAPNFKPNQPYINKGFLRQTHLLNKKYVKLIEAALLTYSTPNESRSKVHIVEKRNTYDNREIDSKHLSFFKNWDSMRRKKAQREAETFTPNKEELLELIQGADEEKNSICDLIQLETAYEANIKSLRYNLNVLYKNKYTQFKLDTILDRDGEAVYKIKILPTPKTLQNGVIIDLGHLLVSAKDFALYELKFARVQNPNLKDKRLIGFTNLFSSNFTLKYKRYKEKLYPTYYKSHRRDFTGMSSDLKNQIQQKKYPRISRELLFTEIIENANEITNTIPKKWNDKLYQPSEYHPEFWENYTILLETKDEAKLRTDLEGESNMQEQYQHSTDSVQINRVN